MDILNTILNTVANNNATDNPIASVLSLLNNQQSGGLMGLVETIAAAGLNDQVASWVGTGANQSVTPEQMLTALGPVIQNIASQMGIENTEVAGHLASLLPQVIDQLTPDGQVPNNIDLQQLALSGLNSLFK